MEAPTTPPTTALTFNPNDSLADLLAAPTPPRTPGTPGTPGKGDNMPLCFMSGDDLFSGLNDGATSAATTTTTGASATTSGATTSTATTSTATTLQLPSAATTSGATTSGATTSTAKPLEICAEMVGKLTPEDCYKLIEIARIQADESSVRTFKEAIAAQETIVKKTTVKLEREKQRLALKVSELENYNRTKAEKRPAGEATGGPGNKKAK